MARIMMLLAGIALMGAGAFVVIVYLPFINLLPQMVLVGSSTQVSFSTFILPTIMLGVAGAVAGVFLLIESIKLDK